MLLSACKFLILNFYSLEIQELKARLTEHFGRVLSLCNEKSQLHAIQGFVNAMEPTIKSLTLSGQRSISETSGSQDKSRKIGVHRRFWKKSKKPRTLIFEQSDLNRELFEENLNKN